VDRSVYDVAESSDPAPTSGGNDGRPMGVVHWTRWLNPPSFAVPNFWVDLS